ncbi:hypothetical protein Trydic_g5111 [Trypoxylus dichotomus]
MKRTGYAIIETNNQREYLLPNDTKKPIYGSEVFVGNLPHNVFEDEIVPIFGRIGNIYKIRLVMDKNGLNEGFCFVTFYVPHHADRAIVNLNGFEIKPRQYITVYRSYENCRLYINGIPRDKTERDVRETLQSHVEGVENVVLFMDRFDETMNRGFAFVDFTTRSLAIKALNHLSPKPITLWGTPIYINWANRDQIVDPLIMLRVKRIYIRNLSMKLTAGELTAFLGRFVRPDCITKICKVYDYAFVHFVTRRAAEICFEAIFDKKINGMMIDVCWAKPVEYKNSE